MSSWSLWSLEQLSLLTLGDLLGAVFSGRRPWSWSLTFSPCGSKSGASSKESSPGWAWTLSSLEELGLTGGSDLTFCQAGRGPPIVALQHIIMKPDLGRIWGQLHQEILIGDMLYHLVSTGPASCCLHRECICMHSHLQGNERAYTSHQRRFFAWDFS